MLKRFLMREPLRWFLLLWVVMAVAGSLLGGRGPDDLEARGNGEPGINSGVYISVAAPPIDSADPLAFPQLQGHIMLKPTLSLQSALIFLLLVAIYSFCLWKGLSGKVQ
ncbi:MAG TPA: hypothetical protein VFN35_28150, partial [Ktedonobacteraceae bacterium]|nr:hypothetical protein [Ktedonobacteraceae bacterium]